jgi:hypothetical protein
VSAFGKRREATRVMVALAVGALERFVDHV